MFKRTIVALIMVLVVTFFFYSTVYADDNKNFNEDLKSKIITYLEGQQASVTVVYKNLVTGEKVAINGKMPSAAASTIKLPLTLFLIEQINDGNIKLNQKLTYKSYHYYGGSGVIQDAPVGTEYTVEDLLKKMLIHSDNIAFIMLKELVGKDQFISYIKELGGEFAYPNGQNLTSANDLILYLSTLYELAKTNKVAKQVINWLEDTDYNETIPKLISEPVAHKVGMIPMNQVSNDAGIVFDNQPYALAIMTDGFPYGYSKQVIADLSSIVNEQHKAYTESFYKIPTETILVIKSSQKLFKPLGKRISTPFLLVKDSFENWYDKMKVENRMFAHSEIIEP